MEAVVSLELLFLSLRIHCCRGLSPCALWVISGRCDLLFGVPHLSVSLSERGWAISIARLRTLPPVHLRPIDVIVFDGPSLWRSYLEGGFVLRCFQHLSLPEAATRRCGWRHNRCTGAPSNTVLSY